MPKKDIKPTRLLYTPNPTLIEQKRMKKINPLDMFNKRYTQGR